MYGKAMSRFYVLTASILLTGALAQPLLGQGVRRRGSLDPAEFREVLRSAAVTLESLSATESDLQDRIAELTEDDLATLQDAMPDPRAFRDVITELSARVPTETPVTGMADLAGRLGDPAFVGGLVAQGIVGVLPGITPFPPAYPMGVQADILAALFGLSNDERCDGNFEAGLIVAEEVLITLAIVAQAGCDTIVVILGEGTNAPFCLAAGVANELASLASFVLQQCQLQDGLVDSAEIEAAFENTLIIIEALKCVTVVAPRRGHGCNGEDDNCNGMIDECSEDVFGPVVEIDAAVRLTCYKSVAEAAEAVALAVKVSDDCSNVNVGAPVVIGTECDVPVQVTATDDCGNSTTVSTVVTIDADGPDIVIDPSVNAPGICYASIEQAEQAVLGAATITDDCTSEDELEIKVHSSVDRCALRVRIDVTDECGNESTAAVTVRVDIAEPVVEIQRLLLGFKGVVLGFQTPPCFASVADAEAAVLAATRFSDGCTAREDLFTAVASAGDPCGLAVTVTAIDECLNTSSDTVVVRVDSTIPVVTCAVAVSQLQPPNHEMIDVGFSFTATDNCSGPGELDVVVRVTSDEPTASANGAGQATPAPDAAIMRNLDGSIGSIRLRAERSTSGNGRVYRIVVQATDACGNVGMSACTVSVPPSNNKPAVDSGQFFDATQVN